MPVVLEETSRGRNGNMKDCIVALKAEIVELRVALDQVKSVEPIAAQRGSGSSNSEAWSTAASRSRQRKGKKSATVAKTASRKQSTVSPPPEASRQAASNTNKEQPLRRPKVVVQGKRKVWGTLRTTTEAAVKNTIKLVCKVDCNLEVKRKYRLSGAHRTSSENSPTPHVAKWWFVISGDESALDQLALSWSAVKLQTNWSLEPVFSYCDGEPNHPQISPACNQPSQLPGDRELADVQITNPGAPDISMSSQSSETPQSISTNQAPDGTQPN